MTLEDRLTELVTTRGADVLDDPGEFRAAVDDYLTDEELSPGDRNVLVDAVRLGAVRRLLALLDQGSDPRAAVSEAGAALARERGSDDARRSLRATALLGYATGRLDEQVLRSFEVTPAQPTQPPPPPTPAPPPPPTPPPYVPAPADAALPPTRVAAPEPAAPAGRQHGRRRWPILVGVAALVLLVVGLGVWWFALRGETPEDGLEEWFDARSCEAAADRMTGPAAEMIQAEIDAGDDSGFCTSYAEYASDYTVASVDDRGDRATIEVDGTQHYDGSDESIPDERDFSATFDMRHLDGEWLVSNVQWTYDDEE